MREMTNPQPDDVFFHLGDKRAVYMGKVKEINNRIKVVEITDKLKFVSDDNGLSVGQVVNLGKDVKLFKLL